MKKFDKVYHIKNRFVCFAKKFFVFSLILISACLVVGCGRHKKDNLSKIGDEFSNYYIDLEYNHQGKSAVADCEINFCNTTENVLKDVKLHLYIANFCNGAKNKVVSDLNKEKCFYNGNSFATLNISRVFLNEKDVLPTYEGLDNDIMVITLNSSLYPTERCDIKIEYNFSLPNCNHRFGYGENTINFGNFYPIICGYDKGWCIDGYCSTGDPFFSNMANYYVNLSCDSSLTVASTGEIKNSTKDDGKSYYNIEAKCVRDFAFVMSEKFNIISKKSNNVTLNYFYIFDENADKTINCIADAINTFSDKFYNYPYPFYNVVEADFCYGGMEFPNLSIISNSVKNYDDFLNVIIHETAHQWWYNLVGNDEYNDSWLDEALTEFSTVIFYDYNSGYNFNHKNMVDAAHKNYVLYHDIYEDVLGKLDTSMIRPLDDFDTEPEYTFTIYVKGVLMFDSLYNLVGKKKFFKALQLYAETNAYKVAKYENLLAAFESVCDTSPNNFFDCWLNGRVIIN